MSDKWIPWKFFVPVLHARGHYTPAAQRERGLLRGRQMQADAARRNDHIVAPLVEEGWSTRAISRKTGLSRNVVRRSRERVEAAKARARACAV